MKRVWQTEDGKSFDTKAEADRHTSNETIRDVIAEGFNSDGTNPVEEVLLFLINNKETIQTYYKTITPPVKRKPVKLSTDKKK